MIERKGLITAAEHMALLQKDPVWVARNADNAGKIKQRLELSRREQAKLLADLQEVGVQVASVWDLVSTADKYPAAMPVLLRHLVAPYSKRIKEGIVRALTVDYAGPAVLGELIKQFREQADDSANSLKWVLGNAISQVAKPADAETVIGHVIDPRHGEARDMITQRLPRAVKDKGRLRAILQHLLGDKQMEQYARRASQGQLY